MKCTACNYKRDIILPYRTYEDDIICCHPDIARKSGWQYAGKIITRDGTDPEWCPLNRIDTEEVEHT